MQPRLVIALFAMMLAPAAQADDARAQFVASNMIATFYHEFGHALVDILDIPVLGREEDAVDALAVLLIDGLWDEEDSPLLIADVAYGYALSIAHDGELDDSVWWGEHSLDEQRFAAMVCQYYGAEPDTRAELAQDLGMPADMADTCITIWEQLADSWMVFLEDLHDLPRDFGLVMREPVADETLAALMREEIDLINQLFGLPEDIFVAVAPCGEANAFYDPANKQITICTEFAHWYREMWDADN